MDIDVFHPGVDGGAVRERYGLGDRPVVVCVSRLVPRKGQDTLIRALPAIGAGCRTRRCSSSAAGRTGKQLQRLAASRGRRRRRLHRLRALGELPAHYAAGDVYAMPCRTRRGGLDVEGLGIVYLEASATGLPVIAGDSGGAPDAVRDGETGFVVDGRDIARLADRIALLLAEPRAGAPDGRGGAGVGRARVAVGNPGGAAG